MVRSGMTRTYVHLFLGLALGVAGIGLFFGIPSTLKSCALGAASMVELVLLLKSHVLSWSRAKPHPFTSPATTIDGSAFTPDRCVAGCFIAVFVWLFAILAGLGIGVSGYALWNRDLYNAFEICLFTVLNTSVALLAWGTLFKTATRRELKRSAAYGFGGATVVATIAVIANGL